MLGGKFPSMFCVMTFKPFQPPPLPGWLEIRTTWKHILLESQCQCLSFFNQPTLRLCICLCVVGGTGPLLPCVGCPQVQRAGAALPWGHTGFSPRGLLLLQSVGSGVRGLSSCGTWAWLSRGMWRLPRPGIEPTSPALAGGFLTTGSPGKARQLYFENHSRFTEKLKFFTTESSYILPTSPKPLGNICPCFLHRSLQMAFF